MTDFAWAIIGPGRLAHRFADAVFRLPGTHLRSVLGRDPAAAAQFVAHWCRSGKPSPRAAATLVFPDGILAQFLCAFDCVADNSLRVFSDAGCISVPQRFWEATDAVLTPLDGALQTVHDPFRFNGFEYEVEEAIRCVCSGWVESPRMAHWATLANLAVLDHST